MMTLEFVKEHVDVFKLPAIDKAYPGDEGAEITIGDLHGSFIKLLFMFCKHEIITNLTEEQYEQFVCLYKKKGQNLGQADLDLFKALLGQMKFANKAKIRLIGDVLADRGPNDYFTLLILQAAREQDVNLEILLSNHDMDFILACEKEIDFSETMLCGNNQANSLITIAWLILNGLITRGEVIDLARKAYQPTLKAISYSLGENDEITIYSHAIIDVSDIKAIADKLEVNFKDDTTVELAQTIEHINKAFQDHVKNNTVHTLVDQNVLEKLYEGEIINANDYPVEFVCWNIYTRRQEVEITRAKHYKNSTVYYVHGHTQKSDSFDNVINLDNDLAKTASDFNNEGEYTVIYSHQHALDLQNSDKPNEMEKEKDGIQTSEDGVDVLMSDSLPNLQQNTISLGNNPNILFACAAPEGHSQDTQDKKPSQHF